MPRFQIINTGAELFIRAPNSTNKYVVAAGSLSVPTYKTLDVDDSDALAIENLLLSAGVSFVEDDPEDLQDFVFAATAATVDATPVVTNMFTPNDQTGGLLAMTAVAVRSDHAKVAAMIANIGYRRSGNTVTLVGNPNLIPSPADTGFSVAALIQVTGQVIQCKVTGLSATGIRWSVNGQIFCPDVRF